MKKPLVGKKIAPTLVGLALFLSPNGCSREKESLLNSPSQRVLDSKQRPNVIIYLIDALRADHLGCYGYDKPITPNIDAFAREAVVFEDAIAQSSWTRPTVASIFTGLYPTTHKVNGDNDALDPEATTLAEILNSLGYHTVAFTTNGNISAQTGLDQGFQEFLYLRENDPRTIHRLSDKVNEKVFPWLERMSRIDDPFFLYVHTTDPHTPYTPPDEFLKRYAPSVHRPEVGLAPHYRALQRGDLPLTETALSDLISLYDAEIAFNDHNFGLFVEELRRKGLYEDSLIIVVADHGEEFYEHGHLGHKYTLYTQVLRVPLIIKFPSDNRGRRVQGVVEQTDIFPTILDYLGLGIPGGMEGHSLFLADSHTEYDEGFKRAFSYLNWGDHFQASLIEGPWKVIRRRDLAWNSYNVELYNHERDPSERKNVFEQHPVRAGYLLSMIKEIENKPHLQATKVEFDEDLRERLKALGYVQ